MPLAPKKSCEPVVPTLKMEDTIKLMTALKINQDYIANQLNIKLPCALNNIGDAPTPETTTIGDYSEG